VPYSLCLVILLLLSQRTAGYIIHDLPPFGLIFWALLRSSVLWSIVAAILLMTRNLSRTTSNLVMFFLAVITSATWLVLIIL